MPPLRTRRGYPRRRSARHCPSLIIRTDGSGGAWPTIGTMVEPALATRRVVRLTFVCWRPLNVLKQLLRLERRQLLLSKHLNVSHRSSALCHGCRCALSDYIGDTVCSPLGTIVEEKKRGRKNCEARFSLSRSLTPSIVRRLDWFSSRPLPPHYPTHCACFFRTLQGATPFCRRLTRETRFRYTFVFLELFHLWKVLVVRTLSTRHLVCLFCLS